MNVEFASAERMLTAQHKAAASGSPPTVHELELTTLCVLYLRRRRINEQIRQIRERLESNE